MTSNKSAIMVTMTVIMLIAVTVPVVMIALNDDGQEATDSVTIVLDGSKCKISDQDILTIVDELSEIKFTQTYGIIWKYDSSSKCFLGENMEKNVLVTDSILNSISDTINYATGGNYQLAKVTYPEGTTFEKLGPLTIV